MMACKGAPGDPSPRRKRGPHRWAQNPFSVDVAVLREDYQPSTWAHHLLNAVVARGSLDSRRGKLADIVAYEPFRI
jgi:hypothetical protein